MHKFNQLFTNQFPILGMLHLKGDNSEVVFEIAKQEIAQYYQSGIDAIIVEDYFGSKTDVERVLVYLNEHYSNHVYGVNVLNDFISTYELAYKYGAKFIQVDSVSGHLTPEDDEDYNKLIHEIRDKHTDSLVILGGVRFKYQAYLSNRSLQEDLSIGCRRCHAIVVTGDGTGLQTPDEKIKEFRSLLGDFPLIVGAGVTLENLPHKMRLTDGVIVGSYFKDNYQDDGNLDLEHINQFLKVVRDDLSAKKGV